MEALFLIFLQRIPEDAGCDIHAIWYDFKGQLQKMGVSKVLWHIWQPVKVLQVLQCLEMVLGTCTL